uniref:transposase n=1 Tax=Methylobacter luteus TaxID=415 RepID=UPI0038B27AFC
MDGLDKCLLRKRNIIETINDQFKNIGDLEYSRHRSSTSYLSNIITSRMTHSYPDKNRLSI